MKIVDSFNREVKRMKICMGKRAFHNVSVNSFIVLPIEEFLDFDESVHSDRFDGVK